jgi:uncharacterized cupredoxin-like copper-binding protein
MLAAVSLSQHADATSAAASPEVVNVELSSFAFSPGHLSLEHGRAYRLHLVNVSGGGHDFSAPEFFAASEMAPADRAKVTGGRVRLSARQSVDLTLTPAKPGTYRLRCSHFLHAGMGMKGSITVE